eukprot:12354368-Alexandrium_andersonii.AAC.1
MAFSSPPGLLGKLPEPGSVQVTLKATEDGKPEGLALAGEEAWAEGYAELADIVANTSKSFQDKHAI